MRDRLQSLIDKGPGGVHLKIRYHHSKKTEVRVDKGVLRTASSDDFTGVGIRALVNGAWGYASTSKLDKEALNKALSDSIAAARALALSVREKIQLAPIEPVTGTFTSVGSDPVEKHGMDEIVKLAVETEKKVRDSDRRIKGSVVMLRVATNNRIILNTDGTDAETRDTKPEFFVRATASEGANMMSCLVGRGRTAGWELFREELSDDVVARTVETSIGLLNAPLAKGGKHIVVMEPAVVGLICHEAIGHTVEADIVRSGSAAKGKIGERVASEHVTMIDSGKEESGSGWLLMMQVYEQAGLSSLTRE